LAEEKISNVVQSVAFTGLGTGVGRVDPRICAKQVRAAIEEVILEKYAFPKSWTIAQTQHQLLYQDKARDLQIDYLK
jgi:O-acetyl-ADP-ribose deacetylase (regulator of RNase III)